MNNYQKIIEAFSSGNIDGIEEKGLIPEHLETQISHLFLFPNSVYKLSKRDNNFFNDHFRNLSDLKTRINFYKADFFENNYFSPEIYLSLHGVNVTEAGVLLTNKIDGVDDVVMRMKRINLKYNLSQLLHDRSLTQSDFRAMGYQQTKEVALYPHQPICNDSYYIHFQKRLDDLRDWIYSAPAYFSKEKADEIIQVLRNYVDRKKADFDDFDTNNYVVSLDNHSDNIFYENKKVSFLDIYPPKEEWGIVSPWINIYRPATDILILMDESSARAFIQGYKDYCGSLDEKHELFYFVYSATIQAISLYNLSEKNQLKLNDSRLYKDFILENIEKLKTL